MAAGDIDISVLKSHLTYDPSTGLFIWKSSGKSRSQGSEAGTKTKNSGVCIGVCNSKFAAHHLALAFINDVWPSKKVKHLDGNKHNNRLDNLIEGPIPKRLLSHDALTSLLLYDPESGFFTWKKDYKNFCAGEIADRPFSPKGYRYIYVDQKVYLVHRLAWFYAHKEWPASDVDHADVDPSNNRISNLRLATKSQNMSNRKKLSTNKSGYKGVSWKADEAKWQAQIRVSGKTIALGRFTDPAEAHAAYCKAAMEHRGEFARVA